VIAVDPADQVDRGGPGKVLLTGGGGDIGRSVQQLLHESGDEVVRLSHSTDSAPDIVTDFRNDAALASAIASITGPIRGVVLCHGVVERGDLRSLRPADWRRVVDINLTSVFTILRSLEPRLSQIQSIVVVSSTAGLDRSRNGGPHYTASKAALNGLVRHLARDLGPRGTRINAVCPGHIEGRMTDRLNTPETRAAGIANIPLSRPAEVARVIRYLLSEQASYVTGAMISVAGGTHR